MKVRFLMRFLTLTTLLSLVLALAPVASAQDAPTMERSVEGGTPASLCMTKFQGSMVGYWRFDNASDPMQPTVSALRGSVVGTSKTATGIAGRSLEFDGQSYVNYGVSMNVPAWAQYTVSIWFKNDGRVVPSPGYGQKIIDKTTWYTDFYLSLQHWDSPGHFVYKTFHSPSDVVDPLYDGSIVVSQSPYLDNNWHHAVMVRNGKAGELWVDGVLKGTNSNMQTVTNNQPLLLGYSLSGDFYQQIFWGGYMDEFAVFNRALSTSEVSDLYAKSVAGRSYCSSAPAAMTIVKQTRPYSPRNFRFYGPYGEFRLDNPEVDDVDGVSESMRYEVVPGTYGFSEMQVDGWRLTDILCSKPERATVNLAQHQLTLTLQAGDDVTCTFVNQQAVTVYARAYWDKNASRRYDVGEPWKSGVWTEIFDGTGKRIAANSTDNNGQVGAFNLVPGSYSICQTPPSGWWNTQPGKLDPRFSKPCYTFSLAPSGLVTGYFGWIDRPIVYTAEEEVEDVGGLEIIPLTDTDEETIVSQQVYLPMIER